jgi:hypothetical protein
MLWRSFVSKPTYQTGMSSEKHGKTMPLTGKTAIALENRANFLSFARHFSKALRAAPTERQQVFQEVLSNQTLRRLDHRSHFLSSSKDFATRIRMSPSFVAFRDRDTRSCMHKFYRLRLNHMLVIAASRVQYGRQPASSAGA